MVFLWSGVCRSRLSLVLRVVVVGSGCMWMILVGFDWFGWFYVGCCDLWVWVSVVGFLRVVLRCGLIVVVCVGGF